MKRKIMGVAVLLAALFCASGLFGQDIIYKDFQPVTLAWDPPTADANGDPIDPAATITYDVYQYDYVVGVTSDQDPAELTLLAAGISATEYETAFPYATEWAMGVRAHITSPDGAVTVTSQIAWSYIAEDADPVSGPFLYIPFFLPSRPSGLRDQ